MKTLESVPYNAADYFETAEDVKRFLESCLKDNDLEFFIEALGIVAKSKGMTEISKQKGLER
mgnify:FL=1